MSTPPDSPAPAPGAETPGVETPVVEPHRPRAPRRRLVPVAVALALLVLGGAVAGDALVRSPDPPSRAPAQTRSYRDPVAGFALRYPDDWHVRRRAEGEGIRFSVGPHRAATGDRNTVSVVVGPEITALPALHTLATEVTNRLRERVGGVALVEAARARLAGSEALRFEFEDATSTPRATIRQYVGRTAAGRPLTVTLTVRDPLTAPDAATRRDFLGRIAAT